MSRYVFPQFLSIIHTGSVKLCDYLYGNSSEIWTPQYPDILGLAILIQVLEIPLNIWTFELSAASAQPMARVCFVLYLFLYMTYSQRH